MHCDPVKNKDEYSIQNNNTGRKRFLLLIFFPYQNGGFLKGGLSNLPPPVPHGAVNLKPEKVRKLDDKKGDLVTLSHPLTIKYNPEIFVNEKMTL